MSAPAAFSDPNLPGLTNSTGLDINTQFLLQSAYLVFFMHCGFAMVRASSTALVLRCTCVYTSDALRFVATTAKAAVALQLSWLVGSYQCLVGRKR